MDFSVVVLTFNSETYIEKCLRSLVSGFDSISASYEVFVIDNGSSDKTLSIIEEVKADSRENIILIAFDHNTGTTYSRNQGLKRAQGDKVIIMDSDAYVNRDTLSGLSQYLDDHSECGLVVPGLTYPDGRFQMNTDNFPTMWHKARRFFFLKVIEEEQAVLKAEAASVDYAISAFWMFTRDLLKEVGYLDERIFYSPEDVDYCIRVWLSGKEIHYLPQYSMVHDAQELSRVKGLRVNKFTVSHAKGLLYLFLKHRCLFGLKGLYARIRNAKAVH